MSIHTLYDDGTVGADWRHSEFHIAFHKLMASAYNKLFTGFGWLPRLQVTWRNYIVSNSWRVSL